MSRADAERALLRLYEMQKITANDMGIFDNEPREKQALWSRKFLIHHCAPGELRM
jgi:hypothetical protein